MANSPDLDTHDGTIVGVHREDAAGKPPPLTRTDVIKTYRYLRIGMIGAVVLLGASILIEHSKVECWQTSISAYYYTPVRAIFVGTLMAVGLSLIVYKGRSPGEDPFLNLAGMLAPVVAIVPTSDVGRCYSIPPTPLPRRADGSLEGWVVANIDNNFKALLVTGALGLVVAALIAIFVNRGDLLGAAKEWWVTAVSLVGTALLLVAAWALFTFWDGFDRHAHGYAAAGMFIMLIGAVAAVARDTRDRSMGWFWGYAAVVALMVVGGLVMWLTRVFGDHTVFALEAYEIALFGVYWAVQTVEKWNEEVVPSAS